MKTPLEIGIVQIDGGIWFSNDNIISFLIYRLRKIRQVIIFILTNKDVSISLSKSRNSWERNPFLTIKSFEFLQLQTHMIGETISVRDNMMRCSVLVREGVNLEIDVRIVTSFV